ncbi:MAG: recombinase family protein, partial [Nitrospirota bacterium]
MSIDSQESELKRLAERDGLKIEKVYKESMSAKAPGRPVFESMLTSLESRPASLLVWKPDRLARNALDGGKISWLMDRGLIQEIRTPEKTFRKTSDDLFMLGLDFGIAKKYVDDLSVNVKRGIRAKLEHGIWHNTAPLGYQNNKADKTIMLDPVAAPFIQTVFELYASGNYNLRELTKLIYEKGLRSKAGKKVDKTGILRILHNPFYYGVMMSHGVSYQGKHESLVSKELFDQANDVLSGKRQSKRQKRDFPLRGFMTCAVCGCALTATLQKGKYVYYYCTNGKGICEERKKHLTADDAVSLIVPLFEKLQVDEKFLDIALNAEAKEDKTRVSSKESIRQSLQKKLDAVRE